MLLVASLTAAAVLLVSLVDAAGKQSTGGRVVAAAGAAPATVTDTYADSVSIAVPLPVAAASVATDAEIVVENPAVKTARTDAEETVAEMPVMALSFGKTSGAEVDDSAAGRTRLAVALPPRSFSAPVEIPAAEEQANAIELVIASGDTLDGLFGKHGLSRADLARILKLDAARRHLQMLKPGDRIALRHQQGKVLALDRVLDEESTLRITLDGDRFATEMLSNPVERRVAHAHGVIESSLFRAAQRAGISDTLIMELAGVFAWDIDFVLDIRGGDRFMVLYEEIWQDGEKLRDGDILAAEFVNAGTTFRAVRFVDADGDVGYFTPEGLNVKKAFLRAPIAITPRVTSNFNPRRLHPVHKKVRPHRGVDYGAPSGTPIKAAGDGKVIFRGRKGGYGNAVILQHGGNITTLYAHMSRFHKRARVGQRVRQGQVIGYVGATGTVTAAHLHYEYRVGGVHRNPRTVRLPKAQPVAAQHREAFAAGTKPLLERLDLIDRSIRLAAGAGSGSD